MVADHPNLLFEPLETKVKVSEGVLETMVPGETVPEKFPITGEEVVGPS